MTLTDVEIKISKGCIPTNAVKNSSWTIIPFQQWIGQRNKKIKEQFPRDMFDKPYSIEVRYSYCILIIEPPFT